MCSLRSTTSRNAQPGGGSHQRLKETVSRDGALFFFMDPHSVCAAAMGKPHGGHRRNAPTPTWGDGDDVEDIDFMSNGVEISMSSSVAQTANRASNDLNVPAPKAIPKKKAKG